MTNLVYGKLEDLGAEIAKIQNGGKIGIVTDQNVAEHYLERCAESLRREGYELSYYIIPPGEENKNGDVYLGILNSMAHDALTRTDGVVALGGGVVGDLGGFVAATFLRGIKVYQVPTSLLAMVDSSIGGKTGIDLDAGKNLAGAFHMPSLVFQDQELLATLSEEELMNGMAEVIKYGIIEGGEFFDLLDPESEDGIPIEKLIKLSCESKIRIVEQDEKDLGLRQLLNLGHTIGHAVEKLSDYEIKHGFAVAMGISKIAEIAERQGWSNSNTKDRIITNLNAWGYDLNIPYDDEELIDVIRNDKKRKGDVIDLVIPVDIGRTELKRVKIEELPELL